MELTVRLFVVLFVATSFALVDNLSQRGTDEYVVSVTTPNITLVHDNVLICVAYNMTSPTLESDFIVGYDPKPFPGMKEYFFFDSLCEEPGYVGANGELVPWDCGAAHDHPLNPPLPRGDICGRKADDFTPGHIQSHNRPLNDFKTSFYSIPHHFQYQNRPLNETRLRLPPGTGIPIGGKGDPKFFVFVVHFYHRKNAANSATGFTTLDLTLKRHGPEMLVAHDKAIYAIGQVDGHSYGNVSTSWTWDKKEDMRLITLFVHEHTGFKAEVRIERPGGRTDVILDSEEFRRLTNLPDSPSVHMHAGDRLVVTCFYHNRMDHVLVIGESMQDRCFTLVHYVVAGDKRQG